MIHSVLLLTRHIHHSSVLLQPISHCPLLCNRLSVVYCICLCPCISTFLKMPYFLCCETFKNKDNLSSLPSTWLGNTISAQKLLWNGEGCMSHEKEFDFDFYLRENRQCFKNARHGTTFRSKFLFLCQSTVIRIIKNLYFPPLRIVF